MLYMDILSCVVHGHLKLSDVHGHLKLSVLHGHLKLSVVHGHLHKCFQSASIDLIRTWAHCTHFMAQVRTQMCACQNLHMLWIFMFPVFLKCNPAVTYVDCCVSSPTGEECFYCTQGAHNPHTVLTAILPLSKKTGHVITTPGSRRRALLFCYFIKIIQTVYIKNQTRSALIKGSLSISLIYISSILIYQHPDLCKGYVFGSIM